MILDGVYSHTGDDSVYFNKREITKNQGHIKGKSQSTMIGMTLTKMELIRAGGGLKHCRKSMN